MKLGVKAFFQFVCGVKAFFQFDCRPACSLLYSTTEYAVLYTITLPTKFSHYYSFLMGYSKVKSRSQCSAQHKADLRPAALIIGRATTPVHSPFALIP